MLGLCRIICTFMKTEGVFIRSESLRASAAALLTLLLRTGVENDSGPATAPAAPPPPPPVLKEREGVFAAEALAELEEEGVS